MQDDSNDIYPVKHNYTAAEINTLRILDTDKRVKTSL
jgi:hypothetical protein